MKRLTLYLLSALAIGAGAYVVTSPMNKSENAPVTSHQRGNVDTEQKSHCSLIDGMPMLENPETVRCTDNASQKVVINVWDQDHDYPEIQDKVKRTLEEVVAKWGVRLVAREGFHGLESSLSGDEKPTYSLSHLEKRGVINIGVDPLYDYWKRLLGIEMDSWSVLKRARKQADACYDKSKSDNCYKLDDHKELKELMKKLEKEVERLNPLKIPEDIKKLDTLNMFMLNLSNYVALPLRSYATTDGIVKVMNIYSVDKVVLSYGAAHALQINGYLDHLGISHIDIILNETFFDQRIEELKQNELSTFSFKGLEDYKKKVAGRSFD